MIRKSARSRVDCARFRAEAPIMFPSERPAPGVISASRTPGLS